MVSTNEVARVEAMIRRIFDSVGISPDDRFEPQSVLQSLDVEIIPGPFPRAVANNLSLSLPWDTVAVSEEIAPGSEAHRAVLLWHLGYMAVARAGLVPDDAGVSTSDPLDDVGVSWLITKVQNRLAIPLPALLAYLDANPSANNFDIAWEFRTTLEIATTRLVELVAGAITTRFEKGANDVTKVRAALDRSMSRIRLIGNESEMDRYVDRDPFILSDPLLDDQTRQVLGLLRSQAGKDGATIDLLIRHQASEDLQAFFTNTPLKESREIVNAIRSMPGGYATIALARLFTKLGLLTQALELLKTRDTTSPHLESEALALRARIAQTVSPDAQGLHRAVELNRQALRHDPTNHEARFNLANVLIELDKPGEALRILDQLKWTENDSLPRFYYAAKAFLKLNQRDLAKQALQSLVMHRGHPYAKRGLGRLAKIYADEHNDKLTIATYQQLFRMRPYDLKAAKSYVRYLLKVGRTREALNQVMQVTQCAPLQPFCAAVLAHEYADAGNDAMAASLRNESRTLAGFWAGQGSFLAAGE